MKGSQGKGCLKPNSKKMPKKGEGTSKADNTISKGSLVFINEKSLLKEKSGSIVGNKNLNETNEKKENGVNSLSENQEIREPAEKQSEKGIEQLNKDAENKKISNASMERFDLKKNESDSNESRQDSEKVENSETANKINSKYKSMVTFASSNTNSNTNSKEGSSDNSKDNSNTNSKKSSKNSSNDNNNDNDAHRNDTNMNDFDIKDKNEKAVSAVDEDLMNETTQPNEILDINEIKEVVDINEVNEIKETNEANKANEINEINEASVESEEEIKSFSSQFETTDDDEISNDGEEEKEENVDEEAVEGNEEIKEKKAKRRKAKLEKKDEEQNSIYQSILTKFNVEKNEELEKSHIIVFGAKDVGKSCLVQALQKINAYGTIEQVDLYQNSNSILPLDYAYLDVRNLEDNHKIKESKGTSHIWIVQHSSYISALVKHLKKFKNVKKIVILMCSDLYKPYNIISDLNHWIESLYVLFEELHADCDIEVYNDLKQKQEDYIYNYKKKMHEKKKGNTKTETFDIDKKSLIKINLAFPIFFVICKSDGYEILNNRSYQGYIDVIICYLRNLAIHYQATIIFCNTVNKKELKNINLLYKYLMHRLYNFPFNENAILNDYEKIFIPSGYDDVESINQSIQNTFVGNFSKPYDSIIIKPVSNKNIVEHSQNVVPDVHFCDFLAGLTSEIADIELIKNDESRDSTKGMTPSGDSLKGKEDTNKKFLNTENNDQSLHSFFQSLLAKGRSKSPSAPSVPTVPIEKKI